MKGRECRNLDEMMGRGCEGASSKSEIGGMGEQPVLWEG